MKTDSKAYLSSSSTSHDLYSACGFSRCPPGAVQPRSRAGPGHPRHEVALNSGEKPAVGWVSALPEASQQRTCSEAFTLHSGFALPARQNGSTCSWLYRENS